MVDLFCGVGGASTGAVAAGYEVVLAVDSWEEGLAAHALNHPCARHLCVELPPAEPLPLPSKEECWHLHGSPPCTKLSIANQERVLEARDEAVRLVRWYVDFALASTATTWSMEQVAVPAVLELLQEYKAARSPHRSRVDFEVFDFFHHGVPQHRRRLIAGSPELLARLRRAPRVHRCVNDVISEPRGTHVRNYVTWNTWKPPEIVDGKRVYEYVYRGPDECCKPVTGPSHVILAGIPLRWATPGTGGGFKLFTPEEAAAVQCFPAGYKLPSHPRLGMRAVGNAIPPVVMTRLLQETHRRVKPAAEPSNAPDSPSWSYRCG